MPIIHFEAKLFNIGSWTILKLPDSASTKLPSRGMTVVAGTINGFPLKTVLEPDGKGGHWFKFTKILQKVTGANVGHMVNLAIEPTKEWPEPEVPEDLKDALAADPKAQSLWMDITPNARWDWIRWIRAVKTPETRKKHVEIALSKLNKGMRRPCCFNRNLCSESDVCKNWVLLDPS